jgi:hypothetical protein
VLFELGLGQFVHGRILGETSSGKTNRRRVAVEDLLWSRILIFQSGEERPHGRMLFVKLLLGRSLFFEELGQVLPPFWLQGLGPEAEWVLVWFVLVFWRRDEPSALVWAWI